MSLLTKIAGNFSLLKSFSTSTVSSDTTKTTETVFVAPSVVSSYEPEVLEATVKETTSDPSFDSGGGGFSLGFTSDAFETPVESLESTETETSPLREETTEESIAVSLEAARESAVPASDTDFSGPIIVGDSGDAESGGGISFDFIGSSSGSISFLEETKETLEKTVSPLSIGTEEKNTGVKLLQEEKPKFIAILGEDISASGFSRRNTLFFKKIPSDKYLMKTVEIFRKNVFSSTLYEKIAVLRSDDFRVQDRYLKLVEKRFSQPKEDLISFTDTTLSPNKVYAYKIRVDYDILTEEQKRQRKLEKNIRDFAARTRGIIF